MRNHESSKDPNEQSNYDEKFHAIVEQNNLNHLSELSEEEKMEELRQQRIRLKGYYALMAEQGYPNEEVEEDEEA